MNEEEAEPTRAELVLLGCYRSSINVMKLSVSLSADDLAKLDDFVRQAGLPSRSAAIQRAIQLLSSQGLAADYAAAWDEWEASGDADDWETTARDGVSVATR